MTCLGPETPAQEARPFQKRYSLHDGKATLRAFPYAEFHEWGWQVLPPQKSPPPLPFSSLRIRVGSLAVVQVFQKILPSQERKEQNDTDNQERDDVRSAPALLRNRTLAEAEGDQYEGGGDQEGAEPVDRPFSLLFD